MLKLQEKKIKYSIKVLFQSCNWICFDFPWINTRDFPLGNTFSLVWRKYYIIPVNASFFCSPSVFKKVSCSFWKFPAKINLSFIYVPKILLLYFASIRVFPLLSNFVTLWKLFHFILIAKWIYHSFILQCLFNWVLGNTLQNVDWSLIEICVLVVNSLVTPNGANGHFALWSIDFWQKNI